MTIGYAEIGKCMQSKRTRIAAIKRHLPVLEDTLERAKALTDGDSAVAFVNQKLVSLLTQDVAHMRAELAELTAKTEPSK